MAKFTRSPMGKVARQINDRVAKMVKELGADADIVQREFSRMEKIVGLDNLRYNKEGALQIVSPATLSKNGVMIGELEELRDKTKTWQQVKKDYTPEYKDSQSKKNFPKMSLKQFINNINDMFNNLPDIYEKIKSTKTDDESFQEAVQTFQNSITGTQDLADAFEAAQIILSFEG